MNFINVAHLQGHLLLGYWFAESDSYDINWTTPQCILTLRFIGMVMDVYDGFHYEMVKPDMKKTAIRDPPGMLEIAAYAFFFCGSVVGPQFTLAHFRQFVNGHHLDENQNPRKSALMPSLGRFVAGVTYCVIYQWSCVWIPTPEWFQSAEFLNMSFFWRWTWVMIWFRLTLYRYPAMWLMSEGSAILSGIGYNGKNENGEDRWDAVRDIHIWKFETGHDFSSIVMSFNCGTNTFARNHIFRRLRWLNSKFGAHLVTLMYLAIWHGYHLGYFILFFYELSCMVAQEQLYSLIERTPGWSQLISQAYMRPVVIIFGHLVVKYSMGFIFLTFGLIKTKEWIVPIGSLYYAGFIFYLVIWPISYQILRRNLPRKKTKEDISGGGKDKSTAAAVPSNGIMASNEKEGSKESQETKKEL
ncbi:hypothetical protein WR25_06936 [Diploscapter pachys]|uniref:Lysophospholipid acyltransferase 5 n=1 Tax=Diploscapter pachys TaxID=2018661 RepID=A0A2A2L4L1_9BILA|nr:hypothetical protein WR25_06936 [Diploscapter pachys]